MSEYRQMLNAFALNTITKAPNIPDYHLMVGSAEYLEGLPLMVAKDYVPKQLAKTEAKISNLTDDEIAKAIENNILEPNDFPSNLASIGNGLGGV